MTVLTLTRFGTAFFLTAALLSACSGKTDTGEAQGAVSGTECDADGDQTFADDGCNTCTCTGGTWACTEIACAEECTDGQERSDGCNTCTCSDGAWACTARACAQCEDGETRQADCNTCTCSGGQWGCTERACGDPSCPPPRQPAGNVACIEVEAWAADPETGLCCQYPTPCNTPAGWQTFSSQADCEGGPLPGTCTPGQTMLDADGCNTCTCSDDGSGWACTLRACVPTEPQGCGGRLGDTCSENEYCAYEEGQYCGAADASSTCERRPDACDAVYDPVCGCDGLPYGNACEAAIAGTGVNTSGECPLYR